MKIAEEIVQRTPSFKLNNVICTECHKKIPTYILSEDNIQILQDHKGTRVYQKNEFIF